MIKQSVSEIVDYSVEISIYIYIYISYRYERMEGKKRASGKKSREELNDYSERKKSCDQRKGFLRRCLKLGTQG